MKALILNFPMLVLTFIWGVVLSLFFSKLYYFHHVSTYTLFVLFSALFSIFAGYYLYHFFIRSNHSDQKRSSLVINDTFFFYLILTLSLFIIIGTVVKIIEIGKLIGGVDTFLSNPLKVRQTVNDIGTNSLIAPSLAYKGASYLINLGLPVTIFSGIFYTSNSRKRFIIVLALVSTTFISLVDLSRFLFLTNISFFFISYIYSVYHVNKKQQYILKKRGFRLLIILLLLTFSVFYGILRARSFFLPSIWDLLYKYTYFYLIGGIPALDKFLVQDPDLLYGMSIFKSVIKWFIRFDLWDSFDFMSYNLNFTTIAPGITLNTYTFIKSLYHDFGLIGVITGSFLWGFTARYLIHIYTNRFSIIKLFGIVIFTFSYLMSFYNFYFEGITLYLLWFISAGTIQFIFKDKLFQLNHLN